VHLKLSDEFSVTVVLSTGKVSIKASFGGDTKQKLMDVTTRAFLFLIPAATAITYALVVAASYRAVMQKS
jgi:hypothetical protein